MHSWLLSEHCEELSRKKKKKILKKNPVLNLPQKNPEISKFYSSQEAAPPTSLSPADKWFLVAND